MDTWFTGCLQLVYGDILITRTGANFGQTALYTDELAEAVVTSHTFILKTNNKIENAFLALFLNTRHGRKLLDQGMYGSSQPEIAPKFIKIIPVPRFNPNIEKKLSTDVLNAYKLRQHSQTLYKQAIHLLEQKLDIVKLQLFNNNYFTTLSTTCVTERIIDPKFHNPKFEQISNHLKANFETTELRKIADVEYGYMPMQDYEKDNTKGIPLIRVTNITQEIEIKMDDLKYIPNWVKVPSKKYVEKGDILIVQCGDTTGKIGYIYEDVKNHLFRKHPVNHVLQG